MFQNRNLFRVVVALCLTVAFAVPMAAATEAVNVNSADAETLALLPRVGPAVAQRIIEFREQNGSFRQKEDLLLVRGIGERTFELIEPYVVLEGESTLTEKVRVARSSEEPESGR